MKNLFKPLLALVLALQASWVLGQDPVRGRVVSAEDNTPLPGASVRLAGTTRGVLSDGEGRFTLSSTASADTLEVSFIGYETRRLPLPRPLPAELTVSLRPDARQLGEVEVVSTGYEELSPERTTGAFTRVGPELLNRSVTPDITSRLKGVAAGLLFDERTQGTQRVQVRGLSTIHANAQPLIVLDNFPYEGDLNAINPNDVESITVLRDAAAASIWGARAGNGVIVITTKKGRLRQPMRVSVNANTSLVQKPDFGQVPYMSGTDFIGVERFLFERGFYEGQFADPAAPVLTPAVELLRRHRNGALSDTELEEQLASLARHDVRDDFRRYLYETGIHQQYALNVSGGSDRMTYYVSGGYDDNRGQLGDRFRRASLRVDNTFRPVEQLTLSTGITYAQGRQRPGRPGYSDIRPNAISRNLYPYARLTDENGNPLVLPRDHNRDFVEGAGENGYLNWEYRPLQDQDHIDQHMDQQQLILTAGADLQLLNGLSLVTRYQYAGNSDDYSSLQGLEAYSTRHLINQYTQRSATGTLSYPVPRGGILDTRTARLASHNGRAQLRYARDLGTHTLSALAGAEGQTQHSTGSSHRIYGFDPYSLSSRPVDYVSVYPLHPGGFFPVGIPQGSGLTDRTQRFTSLYGNAAYTYDRRYVLSGSVRKDASNLFGVNPNQRGVPLWSTGLAWNAHHESFFNLPWVDRLKVRASYGYNGNVDRNLTALATIVTLNSGNLHNSPYAVLRTYPDPDLRWERTATWNAGIDFGLWGDRLSGTLDVYRKYGRDLIGDVALDPTTGVISGAIRRNVSEMTGRGADLTLTGRLLDRGFNWSTTLLFAYNETEVTRYDSPSTSGSRFLNSGLATVPQEGLPLSSIFSYNWGGLDPQTGNPQGYVEGQLSQDYTAITQRTPFEELVYHGPALAPYFGSLLNTFRYKGLSLSVNIGYRFGYYFRRPSIRYATLFNNWAGHSDFADRWQQPGDEQNTQVPSLVYPANTNRDSFYANSAALVERGDHVRLQDVNLGLDLIRPGGRRAGFTSLQVYAIARDLGLLWQANRHGIDPDVLSPGLPPAPTLSLGVRAGL